VTPEIDIHGDFLWIIERTEDDTRTKKYRVMI